MGKDNGEGCTRGGQQARRHEQAGRTCGTAERNRSRLPSTSNPCGCTLICTLAPLLWPWPGIGVTLNEKCVLQNEFTAPPPYVRLKPSAVPSNAHAIEQYTRTYLGHPVFVKRGDILHSGSQHRFNSPGGEWIPNIYNTVGRDGVFAKLSDMPTVERATGPSSYHNHIAPPRALYFLEN